MRVKVCVWFAIRRARRKVGMLFLRWVDSARVDLLGTLLNGLNIPRSGGPWLQSVFINGSLYYCNHQMVGQILFSMLYILLVRVLFLSLGLLHTSFLHSSTSIIIKINKVKKNKNVGSSVISWKPVEDKENALQHVTKGKNLDLRFFFGNRFNVQKRKNLFTLHQSFSRLALLFWVWFHYY